MGFTQSSQQFTLTILSGDGLAGFWHVQRDSNGRVYNLNYADSNAIIRAVDGLFGFNTFRDFLVGMISNSIALPTVDQGTNLNALAAEEGISSQFTAAEITDQDLLTLSQNYDVKEFCKLFGILVFIARYFVGGLISLDDLADIYIYLGQTEKATFSEVENEIDVLITEGEVTQAQKDAFVTRWNTEVGI